MEPAPHRVMIAGDWHGNAPWAVHVIEAARLLTDEERPLILQLGDFGIWPGDEGARYLREVRAACQDHGVIVRFIDGNHEDFTRLPSLSAHALPYDAPVAWLPRGTRWRWHGRTWLALGGGVSLDRAVRTEGRSWWPQEEVTPDEALDVIKDGAADVMITHDCPSGVRHWFGQPPSFWDSRDLARSDVHRERLQVVVDAVRPGWLLHGHLHRAYQRRCDFSYGTVEVTGLDCDGGDGINYAVLDVTEMAWEVPEIR